MITRCPQCHTQFRVTPELLAVRQGLVRCGQCAAIFNGFADLARETAEPTLTPVAAPVVASVERLSGHLDSAVPALVWTPAWASGDGALSQRAVSANSDQPWFGLSQLKGLLDTAPPAAVWTPVNNPQALAADNHSVAIPVPRPLAQAPIEGSAPSQQVLDAFAASLGNMDSETLDGTGENQIEPPARPRADPVLFRPNLYRGISPRLGGWIALYALLGLCLACQAVYLLRSEIAADWPGSGPYLATLCGTFGCTLSLPRQIDQLTIESSDLQADPVRENVVLVSAIIRNRALTAQDYPWLEITFTDTLDRPVGRLSIDAAKYLAPAAGRDEGIPPGGEAVAKTAIETTDVAASGYRLRLFYR